MNDLTVPDAWQRLAASTPARIALGRSGASLPTAATLAFALAHAQARDAVHAAFDPKRLSHDIEAAGFESVAVASTATSRELYLRRPDFGRKLDDDSRTVLLAYSGRKADLAIVVADGLSSTAIHHHAAALLSVLRPLIEAERWAVPPVVIASHARVALGDEIGELLRARAVLLLIGERPGLSSPDSLGVYITFAPRAGRTDGERNCISNIHAAGLTYDEAAFKIMWLLREAFRRQLTGVKLKDESSASAVQQNVTPHLEMANSPRNPD
jgi:ethanolamine ammonia-lyase small subunit